MARLPSWTQAPRLAAAVVALSLGVAACGGSDDGDGAAAGADGDAGEASATGPVIDASVFSGEATTVDGASFDLGPLANQDLVVWFWAPW